MGSAQEELHRCVWKVGLEENHQAEGRPSRGVNSRVEGPAENQKHRLSDITDCHGKNGGRWEVLARVEAGEALGSLECCIQEFEEGKPSAKSQERAESQ